MNWRAIFVLAMCAGQAAASIPAGELAMDIPPELREWYRNPDGSCVQCSLGMCGLDQNVPAAATLLWDTEYGPRERGGSYPERVARYCDRRGIRAFNVTGATTWEWMQWAAMTGRACAIGAGSAHFQTLAGYNPESQKWYVCNNNSPERIDEYSNDGFRRLHLASGPWIVALDGPPHPARPKYIQWWATSEQEQQRPKEGGWGQGAEVDRDAIMRLGSLVQPVGGGARADDIDAFMDLAGGPPPDDSDKFFISVITMKGCTPCAKLKADWAKDEWLRAFAKPDDPSKSWAHFNVYDKDDASQSFRWKEIDLGGFPTVLVQPPRSGKYGPAATVVFQQTGYSGDPHKLATSLSAALRRYVATLPKKDGAGQRDVKPPWKPTPKVDPPVVPAPPDPKPGPEIPVIPPEVKPGPAMPAKPDNVPPLVVIVICVVGIFYLLNKKAS